VIIDRTETQKVPTLVQTSLRQPSDPQLDNNLHHNMGAQSHGNMYQGVGSNMGQLHDTGRLHNDYASRHDYMEHGQHAGPLKKAMGKINAHARHELR
jgi:tRNA A-37 threonylcarbamoyl transferase component Bud32